MTDHLRGLLQPVDVRDAQGTLIGVYTPHVTPEEIALYEKARAYLFSGPKQMYSTVFSTNVDDSELSPTV